jgi:hypothetical protein
LALVDPELEWDRLVGWLWLLAVVAFLVVDVVEVLPRWFVGLGKKAVDSHKIAVWMASALTLRVTHKPSSPTTNLHHRHFHLPATQLKNTGRPTPTHPSTTSILLTLVCLSLHCKL